MRLGIYSDSVYRSDGDRVWTHQAFVSFVTGLSSRVEEVVLLGRLAPGEGRSHYALPGDVRFVPLPHYPRVTSIVAQLRAIRQTRKAFLRELDRLDAVWIFGPHPIALVLAITARRHGTPLFLGVRQDYVRYISGRLPGRKWFWAVGVAHVLELLFRLLARRAPTVAVGDELARAYASPGGRVLSTGFSLVGAGDVVSDDDALDRRRLGGRRILSVGRLDPEKNPLLLVEVLALLLRRDDRWRLTVVGDGSLSDSMRRRSRELAVDEAIEFAGYVPQGDALRALYRGHDVFLHVSWTEGFPQVLFEAQAAGTPTVATAVGGVADAVGATESALLVPPGDARAAADAVTRIADDADLRRALIVRGLENIRQETTEAQLDRIESFFRSALGQ